MDAVSDEEESLVVKKIEDSLIKKMESRDLGLHVDFLKGAQITDDNLLKIFWPILKKEMHPAKLNGLSLERDSRTRVEMREKSL